MQTLLHLTSPFSAGTLRSPTMQLCLLIFVLFLTFLSFSPPLLVSGQSPQLTPSDACKSMLYPKLCRSILSTFRSSPAGADAYGQFSVKQCLKQARKMSGLIEHYLSHSRRWPVRHEEAGALDDCRQLSELNVDYLQTISGELKSAELMTDELVELVRTLLSGIVTNQQTCYDGLVGSRNSMATALLAPLSNATQLYSVSLGLVSRALSRTRKHHKRRGIAELDSVREPSSRIIQVLKKGNDASRGGRILVDLMDEGIPVSNTVIVSQNGTDNFTTIADAISFAPNNSIIEDGYFIIYVKEGYYEEYPVVAKNKKNIILLGDGINRTVITGNRSVVDGWTTFNSASFAVSGERFVAIDITFKNTAGPEKHQAVAVRNNADLSTFYRCSFEGYQDTLYAHSLRQFYRDCVVYGTVDFIFGNSASIFQNCYLYARKPMVNQKNAFTAQGRVDPNQNTGISIQNCTVDAAPDLAADLNYTLSYLGRPWKLYSRTVYMQSYIGSLIEPVGWLEWNGTVGLDTLYYGEFENYGPGADTSMRVQWPGYIVMNASQALNFTVYNFTMGDTWLTNLDIPFYGGLL